MYQVQHAVGEVRTIQPYFTLSTSLNYDVKVMNGSPISHFYSFTADRSDGEVFAVPDASVDILFLCDGDRSKARLCGTTTKARLVEIQKGKRYFGVRFRPGYVPKFADIESKNLVDAECSLYDLVTNVDDLLDQMNGFGHIDDLSNCFIKYFKDDMAHEYSSFGLQIREMITKSHGDIRIGDLERYTGYSSRYISKVFVDNFGLSPKSYALILRFQYILQRMILDHHLNLTNLASDQGYADQSHFLREFKRFAAQAPSLFMRMIKLNSCPTQPSVDYEILALRD